MSYHVINALETLGFNFESGEKKSSFREENKKMLMQFAEELRKKDNMSLDKLESIAKSSKIFSKDPDMCDELVNYLFCKMWEDKVRAKNWNCSHCCYLNQKIMVGGLYRLYNQNSRCGLCGDLRCTYELPESITMSWQKIDHGEKCSLQFIYVLKNHLLDRIKDEKKLKLLQQHKNKIIECCERNKFSASISKLKFINTVTEYCKNTKLKGALLKLYREIEQFDYDSIFDIPIDEAKSTTSVNSIDTVYKCPAMNRLVIISQYFDNLTAKLSIKDKYSHTMHQFLNSLPEYGPVQLLNDAQHIMRHQSLFQCPNDTDCISLRRETQDRYEQKCRNVFFNTYHSNDFIYISMLDEIHVLLYHSRDDFAEQTLNRLSANVFNVNKENKQLSSNDVSNADPSTNSPVVAWSENKIDDIEENKEDKIPTYSTGVYINYTEEKPLYPNLKDEITNLQDELGTLVSAHQFEEELSDAKKLVQSMKNIEKTEINEDEKIQINEEINEHDAFDQKVNKWKASRTNKKYGIIQNQPIQIEHILCIKVYCNYSKLCFKFRESYRKKNAKETNESIISHHCANFYWFARFLTIAIDFFGYTPDPERKFYHGLSNKFVFNRFAAIFETPTSTTLDRLSASNFATDAGIILELSVKYKKAISFSKCLNVAELSDHTREKELLFAGMTVLAITNIFNPNDNGWNGYPKYMQALLYFERITEQNIHQKQYYNHGVVTDKNKEKWKKTQDEYLIPMLKYQQKRNEYKTNRTEEEMKIDTDIPSYICSLIEHYFDSKKIIDLSCIQDEIKYMTPTLIDIFFENIGNTEKPKYEINAEHIMLIFPSLTQYKHYSGYWVNVKVELKAKKEYRKHFESISQEQLDVIKRYPSQPEDFSQELKLMRSLTLTRETSNHFYDMRVATNQKYQEIIEKNQLQPILKRLTSQNIELFSKKYDYNQCDRDFKHCDAVTRIIKILSYYDRLNIASNEQYQDKFIKLMSIYKQFVDDFIHLHNNHCDELKHMNEELIECKITTCDFTSRHHGSVATINDNKLRFYVQLMDTLHFYLYHCYDAGLRVRQRDYIGNQYENDDEITDDPYFDATFSKINKYVSDRKRITKSFERFSTNNRFTVQLNSQEKNTTTPIDEMYLYLQKMNIVSHCIQKLKQFIETEEYDTDCIQYEFQHENDIQRGNISTIIDNNLCDRHIYEFVQSMKISASSFSIGLRFYYWKYYESITQMPDDEQYIENINDHSGFNYCQLFVPQKYASFKEEILKHISIKEYNELVLLKAKQYMISERVKEIRCDIHLPLYYDIEYEEPISIDHLMCIILYCDFSKFCSQFSSTFRQITTHEPLASMKKRNRQYWFMSKLLRESTEVFGHGYYEREDKEDYGEKGPFYSGVNIVMIIPSFRIRLCSPTSTSKQITVATNFCKSQGIVIQLNNTRLRYSLFLRMFDCSWLSNYKEEDERIFNGGHVAIRIESIRKLDELKQWHNFHRFFHAFDILDSMISGFDIDKINVKKNDMKVINKLFDGSFGSFDPYIANCWRNYIFNKNQITINMSNFHDWQTDQWGNKLKGDPLQNKLVSNLITSMERTSVRGFYDDGQQFPDCSNSTNNLISSIIFTTFSHIHDIIIFTTGESGDRTFMFSPIKFLDIICSSTASSWNRITIRALRPHNRQIKPFGNWIYSLWKISSDQLIVAYSKRQLKIELSEGVKSTYSPLEDWLVITRE
eukprot:477680_1